MQLYYATYVTADCSVNNASTDIYGKCSDPFKSLRKSLKRCFCVIFMCCPCGAEGMLLTVLSVLCRVGRGDGSAEECCLSEQMFQLCHTHTVYQSLSTSIKYLWCRQGMLYGENISLMCTRLP